MSRVCSAAMLAALSGQSIAIRSVCKSPYDLMISCVHRAHLVISITLSLPTTFPSLLLIRLTGRRHSSCSLILSSLGACTGPGPAPSAVLQVRAATATALGRGYVWVIWSSGTLSRMREPAVPGHSDLGDRVLTPSV